MSSGFNFTIVGVKSLFFAKLSKIDFSVLIHKSDSPKIDDSSNHNSLLGSKGESDESIQINEISSSASESLDVTIVNTEQPPSSSNSCDKRKHKEFTIVNNSYNFRLKQKLRYFITLFTPFYVIKIMFYQIILRKQVTRKRR